MHPPFSFRSCPKRKRAVHGPKEKGARRAPVQWPSARDGGRRIGASADFARPSGTLWSSASSCNCRPVADGARRRRGAKPHLTSFSFRAFRFATRSPGGRRSCCVVRMLKPSSTTGQRQRKEKLGVSQTSPGQRFPQGPGVSVSDYRAGSPTFPRRRQEVCACADRPAEAFFLFGPCTARFSFCKTQKEKWGVHWHKPAIPAEFRVQWDAPPAPGPAGPILQQSIDWRNRSCHTTFPLSPLAAPRTR